MSKIRMNQMGYRPDGIKTIILVGDAEKYQVFDHLNGKVVYEGSFLDAVNDPASGDLVRSGDFSDFTETGIFHIVSGHEKSEPFTIGPEQINLCNDALLKALYYQRCGIKLEEEFAGVWQHPVCHLQKSYLYHAEAERYLKENPECLIEVDTSGGWHDAGDYGRYTVPAAKAVADLMLAYELFPEQFQHRTHIPESDLPGPDLLHEVRFELHFMLKMQREDGAVYTKVATRYFPGMIMPELDLDPLFVFDVSSPATADFAASMAMAARIYAPFDSNFAGTCLKAANLAHAWLTAHPEPMLFKNPPDVKSGEYGDRWDSDERYWAAAELYRTTGEQRYHEEFLKLREIVEKETDLFSLGWANVGGYGTIAYLLGDQEKEAATVEALKTMWLRQADFLNQRSQRDGYGVTLGTGDYVWGSNMVLMNQAMHLIIAEIINKDMDVYGLNDTNSSDANNSYKRGIACNWDYLFGMNPMDISYVTGLGSKAVMAPHHRPSEGDIVEDPVPGLVSGGPCAGLQDDTAKKYCQGQPPAKCFIDHVASHSTNEITIYWNSPAVFVGAYLGCRS